MGNGTMLAEMRKLTEEKNIGDNAFKRLALAAMADVVEGQEDHVKKYEELEDRVVIVENKVGFLARGELLIASLLGIIGVTTK